MDILTEIRDLLKVIAKRLTQGSYRDKRLTQGYCCEALIIVINKLKLWTSNFIFFDIFVPIVDTFFT